MKKLMGGIVGLAVAVAISAAPAAAQTWVGGGLIFANDMDPFDLGIQAGGYYGLDDVLPGLRVGGDIEFYFPDSETENLGGGYTAEGSLNFMAININAQYFFMTGDFDVYGIGGLSLGRFSSSWSVTGPGVNESESSSHSDTGLNLGAGVEFPMDFGRVYGEVKLVTGDFDRLVIGGGVRIGL